MGVALFTGKLHCVAILPGISDMCHNKTERVLLGTIIVEIGFSRLEIVMILG